MRPDLEFTQRPGGERLAYSHRAGRVPTVVWLCGFHSDMSGTKAQAVDSWANASNQGFLRFDYSGHGQSGGAFSDGTLSAWRADTLHVLDSLCEGPLVLVGSSMGAWIALLASLARPERVAALLLIAPATDFTSRLMAPQLSDATKRELAETGRWVRPSAYDAGGYVITQRLLDDGASLALLDQTIPIKVPVRILQGQEDRDVPWQHALETADRIAGTDVRLTLIKDGDHRLSRPQDLDLLIREIGQLVAEVSA
jgi:pimeloyl-ACP methyl ester carboxylesterase